MNKKTPNQRKHYLPYSFQTIEKDDINAVSKALEEDWITQGPTIAEFEKKFAKKVNSKYAVAVNSGTAALEISAKAIGISRGDEIITTPFTFVATANAALFNQAKPVFADIDPETFNISPKEIEKKISKKTKAIIPVHFAGLPCEMDEIQEIAEKHGIPIMEDACHALGAEFGGKKIGSISELNCFSFHPAKHITTGEGGMVSTNDEKLVEKLKMLRSHGIDKSATKRFAKNTGFEYDVKFLSRNFRITDFQCALGLNQLKKLGKFLQKREKIAKEYSKRLREIENAGKISLQKNMPKSKHAWHLYCILFETIERNSAFNFMRQNNIGVNVHYIPVYRHSLYRELFNIGPKKFPNTENVFSKIISLPIFPKMELKDVEFVAEKIFETVEK